MVSQFKSVRVFHSEYGICPIDTASCNGIQYSGWGSSSVPSSVFLCDVLNEHISDTFDLGIVTWQFGFVRPWCENQLTVCVNIVVRFQIRDGPQIIRHLFHFNLGESTFTTVYVTAGIVRSSHSIFPFVPPVSVWVSSITSPTLSGSGLSPESGSS